MKPYFAKYLPVEGEIKKGDTYLTEGSIVKGSIEDWSLANMGAMDAKKVKLFLCSRDIKVGDRIRALHSETTLTVDKLVVGEDNRIVPHWEIENDCMYDKELSFKVVGEIPWVENFEQEEWSDIEGYEGLYLISSFGRLYSLPRSKWNGRGYQKIGGYILTFSEQKDGYPKATLCKDGKCKTFRPYRLVAKAFIPNPETLPDVNHKDNNPKNCHFSNLEWTNQQRNIAYAVAQGRQIQGERVNHSKLTKDEVLTIRDRIGRKECSQHQLAKEFKVSQGVISDIINRKSWRHV